MYLCWVKNVMRGWAGLGDMFLAGSFSFQGDRGETGSKGEQVRPPTFFICP